MAKRTGMNTRFVKGRKTTENKRKMDDFYTIAWTKHAKKLFVLIVCTMRSYGALLGSAGMSLGSSFVHVLGSRSQSVSNATYRYENMGFPHMFCATYFGGRRRKDGTRGEKEVGTSRNHGSGKFINFFHCSHRFFMCLSSETCSHPSFLFQGAESLVILPHLFV